MRYDMKASETFAKPDPPRHLKINFATATLIGPVGIDQFHIGPFTVKNQTFGLIQEEKGNTFAELPLEGIVGLAFPSMSAGGVKTFFDSVIEQKLLKKNLFAFYLSPSVGAPGSYPSFLETGRNMEYKPGMDAILWGGVDKQLYEGELTWFPVTQAHYWATDLYGFYMGDKKMPFNDPLGEGLLQEDKEHMSVSGQPAAKLIVDSGTAYYTAEGYMYQSFMDEMKCDGRKPPDLTYLLKDIHGQPHKLVLTSEDYMVAQCEPGYVKIPVPKKYGPAMLLGELFMRTYFTVFDRGAGGDNDARIGIARSRAGAAVETKLSSHLSA
jgi:pepsin A